MHTLPIQLRFNDVDAMGHVNNAVIMEFFDLGKARFFSDRGIHAEEGDFTVMVVHVEVDFRSQIHMNDEIAVETELERIGNKSLHILQRVVKSDGTLCAECSTVMAGYCRSTATSAPIPDDFRHLLS